MKHLLHTFSLSLGLLACWLGSLSLSAQTAIVSLPPHPDPVGVSAPFAGQTPLGLLVAGGCNFPNVPAAEGGKKVFYDKVYRLRLNAQRPEVSTWDTLPPLPDSLAYGAMAATAQGLVCIGGRTPRGMSGEAFIINSLTGTIDRLPPLPVKMAEGGAVALGNDIYACGGEQDGGRCGLYRLRLDAPAGWERLKDYPGTPRLQPVLATDGKALFLMGGFYFDKDKRRCILPEDILVYRPETDTWHRQGRLPKRPGCRRRGLVGATAVAVGETVYVAGGVNPDLFCQAVEGHAPADYLKQPPQWYGFNDRLWAFHTASGRWETILTDDRLARAGGIITTDGRWLYMICGETKPGIRSPQITAVSITEKHKKP
ncbi:MAG: cyclically-permuted mutarotase family protein [Alloprevotella sp.]